MGFDIQEDSNCPDGDKGCGGNQPAVTQDGPADANADRRLWVKRFDGQNVREKQIEQAARACSDGDYSL